MRFCEIFIQKGNKAEVSANITAGYRTTGFYPINSSVIIDANLASSLLTHSEDA
jgi:hypothetical protein